MDSTFEMIYGMPKKKKKICGKKKKVLAKADGDKYNDFIQLAECTNCP